MPPAFHRIRKYNGPSRRENVVGSFASSSAILLQAVNRFGHNDRKKLCLLQFHTKWQHGNCPVMSWYKLQQVSAESTTFRRIQHRRISDPPFFHEFLLIFAEDGGLYRTERTGQGSRIDAVRPIGCMAHDYIQYFSATDYEAYIVDKPCELISEIHFPCTFDIIDVLAICYAVNIRPRTRIYTLQRFNCYFFCGTILLVLTRRLTRWESGVTFEKWKAELQHTLDRLGRLSRDQATNNLLVRICRLLEPENPEPFEFIVEALRNGLGASPNAFDSLKGALVDTLWRTTWPERMNSAIEDHAKTAVKAALEGDSNCAKTFKIASSTHKKDMREKYETYTFVEKIYNKKAVDALADGYKAFSRASGEQYRMQQIEYPNSVLKVAWIVIVTHAIGLTFPINLLLSGSMEEWGFKDVFLSNLRGIVTAQAVGVLQARRLLGTKPHSEAIAVGRTQSIDTAATSTPELVQANYDMAAQALEQTLNELRNKVALTVPNITAAIHATLCKNIWNVWLEKSVTDLLGVMLPEMLEEDGEDGVLVATKDEAGAPLEITTVSQYQEFMLQRIEFHANRVEAYHLAAAPLVKQDIRDAMTDVWVTIPDGFSSAVLPPV